MPRNTWAAVNAVKSKKNGGERSVANVNKSDATVRSSLKLAPVAQVTKLTKRKVDKEVSMTPGKKLKGGKPLEPKKSEASE